MAESHESYTASVDHIEGQQTPHIVRKRPFVKRRPVMPPVMPERAARARLGVVLTPLPHGARLGGRGEQGFEVIQELLR